MTASPGLREALAAAASAHLAPAILFAVADPNDGGTILGVVCTEISPTHVRFLAQDGLLWPVAKAALRPILPGEVAP